MRFSLMLLSLASVAFATPAPSLRTHLAHAAVGGLGMGAGNAVADIGTRALIGAFSSHKDEEKKTVESSKPPITTCAPLDRGKLYYLNNQVVQTFLDGTLHPLTGPLSTVAKNQGSCPVTLAPGSTARLANAMIRVSDGTNAMGSYTVDVTPV